MKLPITLIAFFAMSSAFSNDVVPVNEPAPGPDSAITTSPMDKPLHNKPKSVVKRKKLTAEEEKKLEEIKRLEEQKAAQPAGTVPALPNN